MKFTSLLCAVLCVACMLSLVFVSCGDSSRHMLIKDVQKMVNAIIYDKTDEAYGYVKNIISEDNFPTKHQEFKTMLEGVEGYRLKLVDYEYSVDDGITTKRGMLGLYTDVGNFVIIVSQSSDVDGFTSFMMTPDTDDILPPRDE